MRERRVWGAQRFIKAREVGASKHSSVDVNAVKGYWRGVTAVTMGPVLCLGEGDEAAISSVRGAGLVITGPTEVGYRNGPGVAVGKYPCCCILRGQASNSVSEFCIKGVGGPEAEVPVIFTP